MWQYQNTDELYIGRFDSNNIQHSKYLKKYIGKNGKMVYVYPKDKIKIEKGTSFDNGPKDNQKYLEISGKNNSNRILLTKGSNKKNKYISISAGKAKNNYKFKEKTFKVGKYTLNIDNDEGRFNASIHKDHKKTKRGKKIIDKFLNRGG